MPCPASEASKKRKSTIFFIILRYGLLRQSNRASRVKKQVKKWKEDDYYDSDEDEFLDRTGSIANKRQKRMQMEGELTKKQAVDTYETLQVFNKTKSYMGAV
jgi:hypothetical protein